MFNCIDLINKRKELWDKNKDSELDREYTWAVAEKLCAADKQGELLRQEIKNHPEYLIELCFTVVNKLQETVPFFLNEVQVKLCKLLNKAIKDYKEGKRHHLKFLVLKGRQQGFTTFITSYQEAKTITNKNFTGMTVADSSDNTATIFEDKAKFPYSLLPDLLKPQEKYNTRQELHFVNLNSKWRIATAGNKEIGRSKTINFFHGCVAEHSKILLSDGYSVAMKHILLGDKIITSNGRVAEVVAKFNTGVKETYTVEAWLSNETMDFTGDHKILTDRGYVKCSDLTTKDYICLPKIKLTDAIKDYTFRLPNVERPQGAGTKHLESATIPLNYDFGFYLGYYLAEGHIKKQHKSKYDRYCYVEFAYHKDEKYIEKADIFAKQFYTSRKDHQDKGALRSRSVLYGTFLAHLTQNICGRTTDKHIPDWFFNTNPKFIDGVIAGYFSGDGSKTQDVSNGKYLSYRIRATTICESIARQMRRLIIARDYGVPSIAFKKDVYRYDKKVHDKYTLTCNSECGLSIQKLVGLNNEGNINKRSLKYKKIGDNYYVRVRKITKGPTTTCYDITVNDEDHNFETPIGVVSNSEAAFWNSIQNIMGGLGQALTKDSIQILESTANGFNEYRILWTEGENKENNWEPLFFEWWQTSEYRLPFESIEAEEKFKSRVLNPSNEFEEKLKWLLEDKKLEWDQLYWYSAKEKDLKELLPQEYPCTPLEAFLSSGLPTFDIQAVLKRRDYLIQEYKVNPPLVGRMKYNYNEITQRIIVDSIEFVEDKNGPLIVYEKPKSGYPYVIGGDTAEGGTDSCVGQVLENSTGKQVAKWRDRTDTDLFAKDMFALGVWYNKALIAIEMNFDLHPVKELERLNYPNQYMREDIDNISGKLQKKYGWNTNKATRPVIVGDGVEIVRESTGLINDIDTLSEMLVFQKIDGKPQAAEGEHDDCIMSWLIANKIRFQQTTQIKKPKVEKTPIEKDLEKRIKALKRQRRKMV